MILMERKLENVEAHKRLNQLLVIQIFKNNLVKLDNPNHLKDHYLEVINKSEISS
jgi:hypothetical protein